MNSCSGTVARDSRSPVSVSCVIIMWLAHDRVISWSVVEAWSLDISWMWERVYVSYCHSSLLEFVSRFERQNRNPLSSLRTLLNLQTLSSLRTLLSLRTSSLRTLLGLRTLLSLQLCYGGCRVGREWFVSGRWTCWTAWGSSTGELNLLERKWFVVSRAELGERRERSLTRRECDRWLREDRNLVPVCPSTRRTLGRVDSRFVWEFVYRVACWRDRRPIFLKDILEAYNRFYCSFVFF